MLITHEPRGISNLHTYAALSITTGSYNSFFDGRGFVEHQSGQSWSVSEKADDYLTTWYVYIKYCILIHFNIV